MKCFLNANVLFSAANESSQLHRLIHWLQETHELITSDYAQEEAIRNIRAKRNDWAFGYTQIMRSIRTVESAQRPIEVELAEKDQPILATAIAEQCDILVTGDKRDFGHLFGKTIQGVKILTPLMLVETLNK